MLCSSTPASALLRRGRAPCSARCSLRVVAAVRVSSRRSVVKTSTLQALEGSEGAVRDLLLSFQETLKAAQAAKSIPGLLAIDIHEDPWTPGLFNVWERYQTYAELAEHGSSQRQTAFEEKLLPLTRSGIGITLNIWEDGKLGHACVGIGPKGEGGLDDSTGASGTAGGGAGYKQTVKVGANTHRDLEGDTFGLKQASEVKRKD